MADGRRRFTFWAKRLCGLLGMGRSRDAHRIHLIEQVLKAILQDWSEPDELNPHPDGRIAGAYDGRAVDAFLLDPELNFQLRGYGKGSQGLDVAAVPTNVAGGNSQGNIVALIPEFQVEADVVTLPAPPVYAADGDGTRG